uniref:Uncharacterized protein n=1 Tax=Plectus sambesii TaxID=2011161 RepID=A0A914VZ71_9BILA
MSQLKKANVLITGGSASIMRRYKQPTPSKKRATTAETTYAVKEAREKLSKDSGQLSEVDFGLSPAKDNVALIGHVGPAGALLVGATNCSSTPTHS